MYGCRVEVSEGAHSDLKGKVRTCGERAKGGAENAALQVRRQ